MYMTYEPRSSEHDRVDRQGLPGTGRAHRERDVAALLGAGARERRPGATGNGGRDAHAELGALHTEAALRRRDDRVAGSLRGAREREHGDDGEGETAHLSHRTDRRGSHQPSI